MPEYEVFLFTGRDAPYTLVDPEGYRYRGNYLVAQGEHRCATARGETQRPDRQRCKCGRLMVRGAGRCWNCKRKGRSVRATKG